ncbi:unnamed protein product [Caenorhabditis nigoni]
MSSVPTPFDHNSKKVAPKEQRVAPKDSQVSPMEAKKIEDAAHQEQKKVEDVAPKEKKMTEGGEEEPKPGASGTTKPRNWGIPPLAQINVTSIINGDEKYHMVIVDVDPYTFNNPLPLLYYKIQGKKLVESNENDIGKGSFEKARKGKGKKGPINITSVSTKAFERRVIPGTGSSILPCGCNSQYRIEEEGSHQNEEACKGYAIGSQIAEKMWKMEDIDGMTFTEDVLQ